MNATRSRMVHLCTALLLLVPCRAAIAQGSPDLQRFVTQMRADDWQTRAAAFYSVLGIGMTGEYQGRTWLIPGALETVLEQNPADAEQVRLGFIGLLRTENADALPKYRARVKRPPRLSEEYFSYFGDVIAAVAALRDRRALDPLLDDLATGNIATRAVAAFGPDVLDSVVPLLRSGDVVLRNAATRTVGQMLDKNAKDLDDRARQTIGAALVAAASDREPAVRTSAVEGLAKLPGPEAVGALTRLAESDPFALPPKSGAPPVYPVREAARAALLSRTSIQR